MRQPLLVRIADALLANPQRIAGLVVGILLPLLAAGLAVAPRQGGLSDGDISQQREPAYTVPTD